MASMDDLIVPIAGAGLVAFSMFSGGGGGGMGQEIKAMQDRLAMESVITATRQDHLASRAEVALQRYQNGCQFYMRRAEHQRPEHNAAGGVTVEILPVVEGDTPLNHDTGGPYSRGVVLCDNRGNTGIIGDGGVVTDAAFYGGNVQPFVDQWFSNLWGGRRPQL